jgi:alpha-L-arabinofuranosidase
MIVGFTADTSQTVRSTSHGVISLLSSVRITNTLPVTGDSLRPGYWVAGFNSNTGSYLLKTAVYNGDGDLPMTVTFAAVSEGATAVLTMLTAPSGTSNNDIGTSVLKTTTQTLTAGTGGTFTFSLPNLSVSVLEVKSSSMAH